MKRQIGFALVLAYHWVLMIFLGAITFETLILYPNIFRDAPASLEAAVAFMKIGPADFFPPVGMLMLLTGAASVIFSWRVKTARYWLLISVLILLFGEFLFSAVFFWPRNTIMFIEGPAVHSAEVLRRTAREFEALHWVRLGLCLPASVFSLIGLLKYYRQRIASSSPALPSAP
jgi:uncharacterized membrane protein